MEALWREKSTMVFFRTILKIQKLQSNYDLNLSLCVIWLTYKPGAHKLMWTRKPHSYITRVWFKMMAYHHALGESMTRQLSLHKIKINSIGKETTNEENIKFHNNGIGNFFSSLTTIIVILILNSAMPGYIIRLYAMK